MKTLEELYNEVISSDERKQEFLEAFKAKGSTEEVLQKYDCDASLEELKAFLLEKTKQEMSDEEMENVAGGKPLWADVTVSVTTVFGCYVQGIVSIAKGQSEYGGSPLDCF